jgi:hypothetical protein
MSRRRFARNTEIHWNMSSNWWSIFSECHTFSTGHLSEMERTSAADFPAFHSDVGHGCGVIVHLLGQHNALSSAMWRPSPFFRYGFPKSCIFLATILLWGTKKWFHFQAGVAHTEHTLINYKSYKNHVQSLVFQWFGGGAYRQSPEAGNVSSHLSGQLPRILLLECRILLRMNDQISKKWDYLTI